MSIANGLALPNPLSNGTIADAVSVMGDFNYLLSALNRALLDAGGGAGMNAQSTQIHNLANGTSANDAVNLSQLSGYALLSGATFTGGLLGTTLSLSSTLAVAGAATLASLSLSGTLSATGLVTLSNLLKFANMQGIQWTDASGSNPLMVVDSTNLVLYGTNASGTNIPLFAVPMRTTNPTLNFAVALSGTALSLSSTLGVSGALNLAGALTTGVAANCVGYLGVPSNAKTTSYTLALSDMGLGVDFNGASLTCTIPANASVAFPVGTVLLITNLNSSALSITTTSDTLTMSGTTSTGTRTLGQNGEARLRKVAATSWLIGGTNLS